MNPSDARRCVLLKKKERKANVCFEEDITIGEDR